MKKLLIILLTLVSVNLFAQVELVSGGSANAYTLAFPGVFSYSNGISFTFKANFANTGVATINVNSLGAKTIKKHQGADLAANDIKNGQVVTLVYDGTNFQMTSGLGNAPGGGGGGTLAGDVTGDISSNTVEKIRGVNVVATTPTTNQVLQYNGTNWAPATLGGGGGNPAWELGGNSGTDSATNFIGTTDAKPIVFKTNNTLHMKLRQDGGLELKNTALNTYVGDSAGLAGGINSVGVGHAALLRNRFGNNQIGIGNNALRTFSGGGSHNANIAIGVDAMLYYDITDDYGYGSNIAIGQSSLATVGANSADANTAVGAYSLASATIAFGNTSIGLGTLGSLTDGNSNTAIGTRALNNIFTGTLNTGVGSGVTVQNGAINSTAIGANAHVEGSNMMVLGSIDGVNGANASTNVGIGTTQPSERLHIVGGIRIEDGNQTAGYVLTSDANGVGYWAPGGGGGGGGWSLTGNAGTTPGTNFIGTTDMAELHFKVNNQFRLKIRYDGGLVQQMAYDAIAIGFNALANGYSPFDSYGQAIAIGKYALSAYVGYDGPSIAIGDEALTLTTSGYRNLGVGNQALRHNTTGKQNVAIGFGSAYDNTIGEYNTALGDGALYQNTTGSYNTALGYSTTTTSANLTNATAIGARAEVGASNSMVLGAINGVNGAPASTKVGIGTTAPSTALHVVSTAGAGTGFRLVDGSQGANKVLTSDANGNATWQTAGGGGGGGSGWNLTGNAGTDSTINFIGTTDEQPLVFKAGTNGFGMKLTTDGALEFANTSGSSIFIGKGTPASENFTRTTIVGDYAMHLVDLNDNSEDHTAIGYGALYNFVDGSSDYSNTAVGSNAAYNLSNGSYNTALGAYSMAAATEGYRNVAIGSSALRNVQSSDNTAIGTDALRENTSGNNNTAIGSNALNLNTDGSENVAIGATALNNNTSGANNVAIGVQALNDAQTGTNNVAIGHHALQLTSLDAGHNVAVGAEALKNAQTNFLTAVGHRALAENTYGTGNAGFGAYALANNTGGSSNVAIGEEALSSHGFGDNNTALGYRALAGDVFGNSNVAIGKECLAFNQGGGFNTVVGTGAASQSFYGNHNTILGYGALTLADGSGVTILGSQALIGVNTAQNTTVIGASTFYDGDDAVRLGNSLVTTVEGPVAYTVASDARFKTNVSATDVKGLDFINKLRPVNYNFDTRKYEEFISKNLPDSIRRKRLAQDFTTSTAIRQTGFIAQEVEKAAKETGYDFSSGLHTPKTENGYYTVAYSQFVVPLVKAVQELNAKVEALEKENAALKAEKESNIIGYKATYSKTTPITVDDLQRQINDLKKRIEEQSKTH
ncbi:MAG: tail fiber domain-containing protein [Chitinophagales bacterium]|nr:tail fiber domain-containing protein [Chitinophagales bacterium]